MNTNRKLISGIFAMLVFMVSSCNQSTKEETGKEELTPVEGNDQTRYNLNSPDQELINMDSTNMDSTVVDSSK